MNRGAVSLSDDILISSVNLCDSALPRLASFESPLTAEAETCRTPED